MNEIVRNALRARFSDFDFGRPPTSGIFLRPFKRFPIDRMKSRFADGAFSLAMAGCDVLDAIGVIELRFGFLLDEKSIVVVVVVDGAVVEVVVVAAPASIVLALAVAFDSYVCCTIIVAFAQMLPSMLYIKRSSADLRSHFSSMLDFCTCFALIIVVTGRSTAFSLIITVVLYLFSVSIGGGGGGSGAAAADTVTIDV